jgi:hypothetical protein
MNQDLLQEPNAVVDTELVGTVVREVCKIRNYKKRRKTWTIADWRSGGDDGKTACGWCPVSPDEGGAGNPIVRR